MGGKREGSAEFSHSSSLWSVDVWSQRGKEGRGSGGLISDRSSSCRGKERRGTSRVRPSAASNNRMAAGYAKMKERKYALFFRAYSEGELRSQSARRMRRGRKVERSEVEEVEEVERVEEEEEEVDEEEVVVVEEEEEEEGVER